MMTSSFTLEYPIAHNSTKKWVPNIPRTPMPMQLHRLGVREPVWMNIYDRAEGVVERAAIKEQNKRQLDQWLLDELRSQKRTKEHMKEARAKVARDKEVHTESTHRGWNTLLNECIRKLGVYGVSTTLILDTKTNMIFGVDFRCDASKLLSNKLKLQFDHRADTWTWPRDEVPAELALLHVDNRAWTSVWDRLKRTHVLALVWEGEKDVVQGNFARSLRGANSILNSSAGYIKTMQEMSRLERAIESEWGQLLEFAEDALYMWGISVRLSFGERGAKTKYSGIILRFRPIVSTVPVVGDVTIAMPLPSTPASEEMNHDEVIHA